MSKQKEMQENFDQERTRLMGEIDTQREENEKSTADYEARIAELEAAKARLEEENTELQSQL